MNMTQRYFAQIHTLLDQVLETQSGAISHAVTAVSDTLQQGGTLYTSAPAIPTCWPRKFSTGPAVL